MASPQTEDGYAKIANELLDAYLKLRLSGEENQIFWAIVRKTYGFNKREDLITLIQFSMATGLNKQNVCRALSKLIKKNIIIKIDKGRGAKYRIQKDYTLWKPLSKLITLSKLIKPVINIDKENVIKIDKAIQKTKNKTKDTLTKEDQSKSIRIDFSFSPERKGFLNISDEDKKRWKETYPACDIEIELRRMAEWLLANPEKKKKKYRRFIVNWLSKTQDRGGTKFIPKKPEKSFPEWYAEKLKRGEIKEEE
jgi:phage replication O-like protein O